MLHNNINKKKDRDSKNLIITIGKNSEKYWYISDSLTESSKIKIPITDFPRKDSHSPHDHTSSHLKSDKQNHKQLNGHIPNNTNNSSSLQEDKIHKNFSKEILNNSLLSGKEALEEIPNLAKIIENNARLPIIVPSCSQWFKFEEIHEIEMKAFPEYFCGKYPSKSPEIYKESRNYIINLYRENLNTYLTSTSKI
jgi:hypothetical protein